MASATASHSADGSSSMQSNKKRSTEWFECAMPLSPKELWARAEEAKAKANCEPLPKSPKRRRSDVRSICPNCGMPLDPGEGSGCLCTLFETTEWDGPWTLDESGDVVKVSDLNSQSSNSSSSSSSSHKKKG